MKAARANAEKGIKKVKQGDKCKRGLSKNDEEASKRRKQLVVVNDDGVINFDEKELKTFLGFEKGNGYIEVGCGVTNKAYGDYAGKLRINDKGVFSITCYCFDGCTTVNVTPEEFQKHAIKVGSRWTSDIWVHNEEGEKVALRKTPVMKYYTLQANVANWKDAASRKRNFHRDEFIRCSICNKERRFRLRTRQDILVYHSAVTNKTWNCSHWPNHEITCSTEEERPSLRAGRGCPRASVCPGCPSCVCGGCIKCRFEDCKCQECRDFMLLAEP